MFARRTPSRRLGSERSFGIDVYRVIRRRNYFAAARLRAGLRTLSCVSAKVGDGRAISKPRLA
jgi:hypothetical protein